MYPVNATLVWFRQDQRLEDNSALSWAAEQGGPVIPVYIWATEEEEGRPLGRASQWWLRNSVEALNEQLLGLGSRLVVRQGPSTETLKQLATEVGASSICWNRRYEPAARRSDSQIETELSKLGLRVETFNSTLLFEPREIAKGDGKPYQVFTPFWLRCLSQNQWAEPTGKPAQLLAPPIWPDSRPLPDVPAPTKDHATQWTPGAEGAKDKMAGFLRHGLEQYATDRERPDLEGTSSLSPHLHFGEVGPRQLWQAVESQTLTNGDWDDQSGPNLFLKELGWREFAHHLLYHFPDTVERPLRPEFEKFPWRQDANDLSAWQNGKTGYPLVDAGMRQLANTGWMHNRVRMVVASFLVKHLMLPWQEGAGWFWDRLVDADLANNTLGWQWSAGCGADAAPYFRIFNPVAQGEKFDPNGDYVRRWVPELSRLPNRWIHRPWEAPAEQIEKADVSLGKTYPWPLIDHSAARQRALDAFAQMKNQAKA